MLSLQGTGSVNVELRIRTGRWARLAVIATIVGGLAPSIHADEPDRPVAILGAMRIEITPLLERMTEPREEFVKGVRFAVGELSGRSVVIAETGVGKVNASIVTTLLIHRYQPRHVIFTGIAGALNPAIRPGDVVICTKAAQHDFGNVEGDRIRRRSTRSITTGRPHGVFMNADVSFAEIAQKLVTGGDDDRRPKVSIGSVVTGDVFVVSRQKVEELRNWSKADVVEMEGGAVAQVCRQFDVPWLIVRSCSDSAAEQAIAEVRRNQQEASQNAAMVTASVVAELKD